MNEKVKKILFHIGYVIVFLAIGSIGTCNFLQGRYNSKIDKITSRIVEAEEINTRLRTANTELERLNNNLSAEVKGFRENLARINSEHTAEIERIRNTLAIIAIGLGETTGTIDGIIEGIEQIKELVKSIPDN